MAIIKMKKTLKKELLADIKLKDMIFEVENFDEFLLEYLTNITNYDYYLFFNENTSDDIKETLEILGYSFNNIKKLENMVNSVKKNDYEYDSQILEYLENLYPDRKITTSVKKLIAILDKQNLITKIEDITFFYSQNVTEVISSLNSMGFTFVDSKADTFELKTNYIKEVKIEQMSEIKNRNRNKPKVLKNNKSSIKKTFIFDKKHPESYYATTRNIPEMKLRMIEDGISYGKLVENHNNPYVEVFKQDNKEIESYFSKIINRRASVKENQIGSLIKSTENIEHDYLHYRLISLFESSWVSASNWMLFFIALGEFIELHEGSVSFFISYIERTLPTSLTSVGIMEKYFTKPHNFKKDIKHIAENYQINQEVKYLDGDVWRRATVVGITNKKGQEKFNPYLELSVDRSRRDGNKTYDCVPYTLWAKKIRSGGVSKGFSGKTSLVNMNDRISEVLGKRYPKKNVKLLKMYPELHVNLIGTRINTKIRSLREEIQFSDCKGSFMLTDLLYFDNDNESNYVNVHIVSSEKSKLPEANSISLFVGAKTGLDFSSYKTKKNIYFTSRIRENYIEDTEILLNSLEQESHHSRLDREQIMIEFREYLHKKNIDLPRGCEIGVY